MAIKGNIGEWSEIYTLFRLLGEGKVHAGDANLNKLDDLYYPILSVIREESKTYEYMPDAINNIVVCHENGSEFLRIPMSEFASESTNLLQAIKDHKKGNFTVQNTENFMGQVRCSKLKAKSSDKSDIHIIIHDLHTNMKPLLGFSIKSQLGSPSTLLNASRATNIIYRVTNKQMPDKDFNEINAINEHLQRIESLIKKGYSLEYLDTENQTFKNNLLFLDCCMPQFIALCLISSSLPNNNNKVKEIVEKIAAINPLKFTGRNIANFYEHKMKSLLLASALGMRPSTEWSGHYEANGGYLVVRKDGEIVCYHFYNLNDVEDYLYNNTRFDRGEHDRHKFGFLYRGHNNETFIKLNLQIRFIK